MDRRHFLRMMAGAAVALRFGKVAVSKATPKAATLHTPWMDHAAPKRAYFSGPAAEQWIENLRLARRWNMTPEHVNCLCTYVIPPDEAENLRNGKWLIDGEWV